MKTKYDIKNLPVDNSEIQKTNCWEFMQCGREPGGVKVDEKGVCPASVDTASNKINSGVNAGRSCWAVAGTFCGGIVQGTFAQKRKSCLSCNFFIKVIEEENKNIEKKNTNLNECLDATVSIIWNTLKIKCTVNKEYAVLPLTNCCSSQLTQAFVNILLNAADAIKYTGTILIKTWCRDQSIFISISDTGCGIPESDIENIFEPFFTTAEDDKKRGLGLRIAHDIIKKHDGKISVESEVGHGTTFTIELPAN